MKKIDYIELGGTLFVPASHQKLGDIVMRKVFKNLKSLVIDFEDGLRASALDESMASLGENLLALTEDKPYIFLRVRDEKHLEELLKLKDIVKIDGFVLAKFSLNNAKNYLSVLENRDFAIMPSIEGKELFNQGDLLKLRDILLTQKEKIALVRFGLEDMLRQLSMKRSCEDSIFDLCAPSSVLGTFIAIFKSSGFAISGGVYPCFKDDDGFKKDVKRDLKEGLFSKTIIHPNQIEIVNELYKVTREEFEVASAICQSEDVVFNLKGEMAEKITMNPHSEIILKRAKNYGIQD